MTVGKFIFWINVRFWLGLASSLSATVNESKKFGPRYLVDGVLVCASSDLCVSSLKVESPGWPNDDTTSDWLGSQSLSEWALGRWKKFLTRPLSVWQRPHELKGNDRRKIYFRINVRFRLGLASSLSATVNESKRPVLGISSMGCWCARVVTCAFPHLKSRV